MLIPDSLLVDPCGITSAGNTVRSLATGYVKNTSCVFDYRLLLNKQREWKEKQKRIFEDVK